MRKLFALIAVLGMLTIGASSMLMAQENETTQTETTETTETYQEEETTDPTVLEDESQIESTSFHAALKQKFIEGGAAFTLLRKTLFVGALPDPYVSRMIPFNPGILVTASITSGLMPGNIFNIAIFVSTSQNALTGSVRGV